jgi:DNA-3-methyladenine glycosylase II
MTFNEADIPTICRKLAKKEKAFAHIIKQYGYPPLYSRKPSYQSIVHIILEQQVSLASAKAAFNKLKQKIGTITPAKVLQLTDAELKECYFSRQKIIYVKELAIALIEKKIVLQSFFTKNNDEIRAALITVKGIGNWTVDVYLMFCLQRTDLFPIGDIALINSAKHEFALPKGTTKETILAMSQAWQPYRTIASFMLWHAYIQRKGIVL